VELTYAVLDIETIPRQSLPEGCKPEFDESEVKLGNLKDRFKIEEKINEAREKFLAGLDKKMATDPDFCQVVCMVGYQVPRKEFFVKFAKDEDAEYDLLHEAWNWIREQQNNQVPIVGFNSSSFDVPALIRCAMYQDVSVAPHLIENLMKRQDINHHHYDLMQRLAYRNPFSGKAETRGLNYYLKRFDLGGKLNGLDGSMVYPAWKEGRFQHIIDYCQHGDVTQTAALFERVAPWMIPTKPKTEEIIKAA
jgi:predicted PolB exonuclease-like 3'-5' exonuclease